MGQINKLPSIFKLSFIYSGFGIISTALPVVLLPWLTNIMAPEEYLYVDLFNVLFQITIAFLGLGVYTSVSRHYHDRKKLNFSLFLSTVITFSLITMGIITLLIPLIKVIAEEFIDINFDHSFLLMLFLFTLMFQISEIYFQILIMESNAVLFGSLKFFKAFVEVFFTFVLIVYFEMTWLGRILGQVFGVFILLITASIGLLKKFELKLRISKEYLKSSIEYSLPISMHLVAVFFISYIDRFFILSMVGEEEAGLYAVAYQVGLSITLIGSSFNKAWVPYAFKELDSETYQSKCKIVKITYFYCFFLLILVFMLYSFGDLIFVYLLDEGYYLAKNYVVWIALGCAFNGMYNMMATICYYVKKTKELAIATILIGVINLGLNYYFISRFGTIGAAYSTSLTFFTQFLVIWVLSNKIYPMPWFHFYKVIK
jgi:O-antigen/teichoic acid export membrane protein